MVFEGFQRLLRNRLGIELRRYQFSVAEKIVELIESGSRFVTVSMPTGSGKTLIEMAVAHYFMEKGLHILVVEPTRFLCDQMYAKLWSNAFGAVVGKDYEGLCVNVCSESRRIVIATPRTSTKCIEKCGRHFEVLLVDEVHHMFTNRYYADLLRALKPKIVVGFTALLPRAYMLYGSEIIEAIGKPIHLHYDFKRLAEIDPEFKPPYAIVDFFDAEMDEYENNIYDMLFAGRLQGEPTTIKRLELVLARYGLRAFCKSYGDAVLKGRVEYNVFVEKFCSSGRLSHKARILATIMKTYGVGRGGPDLAIVFTSRRITAHEFREALLGVGYGADEVAVLTGELGKDERLKLLSRARKGYVKVIVSTLVGEEGIDIPEAELLVLTDIPASPLRFYQRIGRLIRMAGRRNEPKYLVISLTPGTREYDDLMYAVQSLQEEGIDVSYVIPGLKHFAGVGLRIVENVNAYVEQYGGPAPYTFIAYRFENPIEHLLLHGAVKHVVKRVEEVFERMGLGYVIETDKWPIAALALAILNRAMNTLPEVKEGLEGLEKALESRLFSEAWNLVRNGKLLYIYGVEELAQLLSSLVWLSEIIHREHVDTWFDPSKTVVLERKALLTLFIRLFPVHMFGKVVKDLAEIVERTRTRLRNMVLRHGWLDVEIEPRECRGGSKVFSVTVLPQLLTRHSGGALFVDFKFTLKYYDVPWQAVEEHELCRLMKLNAEAIGYRVLELIMYLAAATTAARADDKP